LISGPPAAAPAYGSYAGADKRDREVSHLMVYAARDADRACRALTPLKPGARIQFPSKTTPWLQAVHLQPSGPHAEKQSPSHLVLAKTKRMSNKSIKLPLVEDNAGDALLLREKFKKQTSHSIELTHVPCMKDAEKHLAICVFEILLLDLGLPDAQGMVAVRRCRKGAPQIPLVVLTGLDDESLAAQVLQEGAQDHLIKGRIETRGLLPALGYAVERKRVEDALFVEKERAQVTLNSIGDAVICTDLGGKNDELDEAGRGGPSRGRSLSNPGCQYSRDRSESD
jgi:CheY-like chemotaxis protein